MTSGFVFVDDAGYDDMWRINAGCDVWAVACE